MWQAIFNETGGSENAPVAMWLYTHLLAASVKWIPSQMIVEDGSSQDFEINIFLPFTIFVLPHLLALLKLYLPPCPQHTKNGSPNP